jgi:hypothetical protein
MRGDSLEPIFRQVKRMGKDTVSTFRELLNDFKEPYLSKLEEEPLQGEGTDIQSMGQIDQMLKEFDILYRILKRAILNPATPVEDVTAKSVLSVFEKGGVLAAVRGDPSLKEDLLYALDLDLRTYPFTRSLRHINELEHNNVTSFQHKIVPNT